MQVHCHIDHGLATEQNSHAGNGKAGKRIPFIHSNFHGSDNDEGEKCNNQQAKNNAIFFRSHRKYKVGMTVGNNTFDSPLARPLPEPAAVKNGFTPDIHLKRIAFSGQKPVDTFLNVVNEEIGTKTTNNCKPDEQNDDERVQPS